MNQSSKQLNNFRQIIDSRINHFFASQKDKTQKISPLIANMVSHIHRLCQNGKRLRSSYIYYSYIACGGKNKKMILDLAIFIEIIHCFLLIHDDIIDEDNLRRGVSTLHFIYEQMHRANHYPGNSEHYGQSMAILGGDMASIFGYSILAKSKLPDKIKNEILNQINSLIQNTIAGEIFDIEIGFSKTFTKNDVINILEYKTAKYTIEAPMHIGAIAAGKNNKRTLKVFSNYAIPLGTAFQIQDDILGIFGNEQKLGKPVGSDIREGKRTLLIWHALEKANQTQIKILKNCLGNKNLTKKQIDDFKQTIIDTDSLDYARKESANLLSAALQALNKIPLESEGKNFLIGIANYLINRET